MFAAHHQLDNLIVIVDNNAQQAFGYTKDVSILNASVALVKRSIGTSPFCDGHDIDLLQRTISGFSANPGKPHILIAQTTFGKGVSFMEGQNQMALLPSQRARQYLQACEEVEALARKMSEAAFIEKLIQLAGKILVFNCSPLIWATWRLSHLPERIRTKFSMWEWLSKNMVGIATGWPNRATFLLFTRLPRSHRCGRTSFIRNGPLMHRLPVRIGWYWRWFEYSHNGLTHFALEDIALMRGPARTACGGTCRTASRPAPFWKRPGICQDQSIIGWAKTTDSHSRFGRQYETGEIQVVREGADCLLAVTGRDQQPG